MRHKKLKLSAILLLGLGLTGLQAQIMDVKQSNGALTAYTLSNLRKMTFSAGNANIQKTDNSTGVYALSGLRYLSFKDITTSIEEQAMQPGNSNMLTYPNPVSDELHIDLTGIASEGTISILTLDGTVLQTQHSSGNRLVTINLSQLPPGIYLCRYSSPSEIKTVKIIKQ